MSESGEEYLEALWYLRESGDSICRIRDIAQLLDVQPPSAVEMLRKLEKKGLVTYRRQKGIIMTEKGETEAKQIVRAHRLMEVLLNRVVHIDRRDIEEIACSCEHSISSEVATKLCIFLDHPRECPHGNGIPRGECCPEQK